jgi:hypothetical protein
MNKYSFYSLFTLLLTPHLSNGFTYDYEIEYENNTRFSTGLDENYILESFNNTELCNDYCSFDAKCSGYFSYYDNEIFTCNALSNLGDPQSTNIDGSSYKKIIHYNDDTNDDTVLAIYVFSYEPSSSLLYNNLNTTVYVDLNHNSVFDSDEPHLNLSSNDYNIPKDIYNLSHGIYEVRQVIHNESCLQLYPGENSSYMDVQTNGYVDNVISYYHDGNSGYNAHENIGNPHGGIVGSSSVRIDRDFSFLLGDNNGTYLSFFPGDNITMHLSGDIVYDSLGTDIYFNLYNDTFTNNYAEIFVGTTLENMTYMDILNQTHYEYDILNYQVPTPIRYISLQFYGDQKIHFNIRNILFQRNDRYAKPFKYVTDLTGNTGFSFFINTCNPPPTCQDNCDFNLYDNADYYSCVHGCKMFERYHYCDCETSDFKEEIFNYYSYIYQANYCNYGCQYAFDNYLGSNYSVVLNTRMTDESILGTFSFDNRDLLDRLVDECNTEEYCESVSLGDENGFTSSTENENDMISNHSYITILKNRIPTPSSTPTSTPSSTPTSTLSSTQTTTPSSTQSSTLTTTQTTTTQTTSETTTTTQTTSPTTQPNVINVTPSGSLEYYYIIIIVGLILLVALIVIAYYRTVNRNGIPNSHVTPSFSNPVYNEGPEELQTNDPSLDSFNAYQDVLETKTVTESGIYYDTSTDNIDDNYLDISQTSDYGNV